MSKSNLIDYPYRDTSPNHAHAYILPTLFRLLEDVDFPTEEKRVFELGCGNGSAAMRMEKHGYSVAGVDPSEAGIEQARSLDADLDLHVGSAYDDLANRFGSFPVLVSLEVVEHVYDPRTYAQTAYDLLQPGGRAIISTPYHGYMKNLAIALTGKYDRHHNPLWDHGHIKFWSMNTLETLLSEVGFKNISFERVGRIPVLAKSMIAVAHKPGAPSK